MALHPFQPQPRARQSTNPGLFALLSNYCVVNLAQVHSIARITWDPELQEDLSLGKDRDEGRFSAEYP